MGGSTRKIKPGETEVIEATYQSTNLSGKFTKKVTVTTNDPKHTKEILTSKGNVLVPFNATPRYANFPNIEDGISPMPMIVTLEKGDGGPLKPEILGIGKSGVVAELNTIKEGEKYELVIGLEPPQKAGKLRTWVKIKTGVPQMAEKTVPVYADIPGSWDQ